MPTDQAHDLEGAREEALRLIDRYEVTAPPVPVYRIARGEGLQVFEQNFGASNPGLDKVSGYIDIKNRRVIINSTDIPTRQVFTVAHELGHWILHREQVLAEPAIAVVYRRPLAARESQKREQEANAFAGTLLVPPRLLRDVIDQFYGITRQEMSRIFGVSVSMLEVRLQQEGLL